MDCDKAETKLAQPLVSFENDEACLEIPEGLKRTRFKLAPASVNRSRLLASMIEQAKSSDDETRAPIPISSMELLQWLKHVQTEAGPPQEVRQPRAQARSILDHLISFGPCLSTSGLHTWSADSGTEYTQANELSHSPSLRRKYTRSSTR